MHGNYNNYKNVLNCDRTTNCLFSTGVHIFNADTSFPFACSFLSYWLGEVGEAEESCNKTWSDGDKGGST